MAEPPLGEDQREPAAEASQSDVHGRGRDEDRGGSGRTLER